MFRQVPKCPECGHHAALYNEDYGGPTSRWYRACGQRCHGGECPVPVEAP